MNIEWQRQKKREKIIKITKITHINHRIPDGIFRIEKRVNDKERSDDITEKQHIFARKNIKLEVPTTHKPM